MSALISVYDKTNIGPFARFLRDKGVRIISTGGTYKMLCKELYGKDTVHDKSILVSVSDITEFPEILNGRVKTLHPKIHGALLAKRSNGGHMEEVFRHNLDLIDIVVVNLYPFQQAVSSVECNLDTALENIDIGGHTLIRASAKNFTDILTITDPTDYQCVMANWENSGNADSEDNFQFRKQMALKAWDHIVQYDMAISSYFQELSNEKGEQQIIYRRYQKVQDLKYGTNPQQLAALYSPKTGQLPFTVLNGQLGYINIIDAIYGWNLVCEAYHSLRCDVVASYKHNSPAGVAASTPLSDIERKIFLVPLKEIPLSPVAAAFVRARNVDPMSSFGDFIAVSGVVDAQTARLISQEVSDGIIAHGFEPEALGILKKKKKGNYVILQASRPKHDPAGMEVREMHGICLVQSENQNTTTDYVFSKDTLASEAKRDMILANITLKYTQSNSVASALNGQVLGVGAGQQSRIDCVKLVKRKTEHWVLRQHPKCIELLSSFPPKTKRTVKVNALVDFIENTLTNEDKTTFLEEYFSSHQVSLASDAFFPFKDNIDMASQFGVKFIIQPGGSVQDDIVMKACAEYDISMTLTGRNMRMFLH